jgi:hypothetical protein
LRGVVYAVPAGVLALVDVRAGAVMAIGSIPAAVIPLAPRRSGRRAAFVVGALAGVSLLAGALLAQVEWLAVAGIAVAALAAAGLATRHPQGIVALTLCLPLLAVGFSYPGWTPAGWLSLVLVAGSSYGWLVSLAWPERPPPAVAGPPPPGREAMWAYGAAAGAAGAICATVGFAADLEHAGWAATAALLVMRPSADVQRLRSLGRIASVVVGAAFAVVCLWADPPVAILALLVVATVVAATSTATSRWYVTPAFTTCLVFLLLVTRDPGSATRHFWERVAETAGGVAVAWVCGAVMPGVVARLTSARRRGSHPSP